MTQFGPETSPPLPWSPEQVEALNHFQKSGRFHPFTCGGQRHDAAHIAYAREHGGDRGQLIATENGWICPVEGCPYTQNWAHAAMFRKDIQEALEEGHR